jgi:hypothetical protein
MEKTLKTIILILVAVAQISCNHKDALEDGATYSKNMIGVYLDCKEFNLRTISNKIEVVFYGDRIHRYNNSDKFYALAEKYHDTEFNRKRVGFNQSINDSISSISIKCDKDIDEDHPAGSELNDLFSFQGKTVYYIIQDHYNRYGFDEIQMKAKDVTPAKTCIMLAGCTLILDNPPVQSGTYTFVVSIELSKQTLKNTIAMEL